MAEGQSAEARLERLLHVLPAAMRPDGASLSALARTLRTTPERIVEDIEELTARSFYQPGGWPDDVQIFLEGDRVQVWCATGFERPVRLNRDETLCLALALRGGAAAPARLADAEARAALLERAERHLGHPVTREGDAGMAPSGEPEGADPEGIRETLVAARRDRRPAAIWYVKAGARDGSVRVVHPYEIVYAEGAWYAVAYCTVEEAVRVFRLDRVLACDLAEGSFEPPPDFRVEDHLAAGRLFVTREDQPLHHARVRYSARIARWMRERARWEPERLEEADDGSVSVRHEVADPQWIVSHTLQYGADAEVVEPEAVRAMVREVATALAVDVAGEAPPAPSGHP